MTAAHDDFTSTTFDDSSQLELFRTIGVALQVLFERSGIVSKVSSSADLPYFKALTTGSRHAVLRSMSVVLECGLAMEAARENLSRNRSLAWRVMTAMGFTPLSDAFDLIAESDILEIYDSNGKVVFATPVYFDLTSYSMEDLYCRPWTDLWGRDPHITEKLMAKVAETLAPGNEKTILLDIPEHEVVETSSYERRRAIVKPKLFSPVKDRFGQRGFLSVNSVIAILDDARP